MKFDLIELRALATDGRYSTVRVASIELLALIDEIERLRALCASQQANDGTTSTEADAEWRRR
jgi:hypothetical protein